MGCLLVLYYSWDFAKQVPDYPPVANSEIVHISKKHSFRASETLLHHMCIFTKMSQWSVVMYFKTKMEIVHEVELLFNVELSHRKNAFILSFHKLLSDEFKSSFTTL